MSEQTLQVIRERLPEYVGSITSQSRTGFWVCPLCGSGTGPNRSGAFRVYGDRWKCFSCGCGGDVFDLIGKIERIPDFRDQARRAEELFHIDSSLRPEKAALIVQRKPKPEQEATFIPDEIMLASFKAYGQNNFALWLVHVFGESKALDLTFAYGIGTSKHWAGATVFWQIDEVRRIRRGKVMLYNAETGRRVKEPGTMIAGVHWLLGIADRKPNPCLFGLHLLTEDRSKPVAIVESEKSAIIGAGFVPEFIWMATGGSGMLNQEMLKPLMGRRVVLFPDLGAFEKWKIIAQGLKGVEVSEILEKRASDHDRIGGLDVADFLLREHS